MGQDLPRVPCDWKDLATKCRNQIAAGEGQGTELLMRDLTTQQQELGYFVSVTGATGGL